MRFFPRRSRSELLPWYLLLGLGNLVLAFALPGPVQAVVLFCGITVLLLIGTYLRWSPVVVCTLASLAIGAALAIDTPSFWNPVMLALGVGACGFVVGVAMEQVLSAWPDAEAEPRYKPDEPILAELVEPGQREPAKVYSVPRRYDLTLMLVVMAAYAMLFSVMQMLKAPPGVFVGVALFFTSVGVGQALLFGGKQPRLASELVGAVFFFLLLVIGLIVALRSGARGAWASALGGLVCLTPTGFLFGYLAGTLIAGIFLVADAVRSRLRRAGSAELDAEGKRAEEDRT